MIPTQIKTLLSATLLGLFVATAQEKDFMTSPTPVVIDQIKLKKIKEPSGICFHAGRKTLFVIGDRGHLGEMKADGTLTHRKRIRKADFEGITSDPNSGRLYLVIEGAELILEVDPDSLEILREFQIERTFNGKTVLKEGGDGIEGITFAPNPNHPHGGTFYAANQSKSLKTTEDPSAIFELEVPLNAANGDRTAKIKRHFSIGAIDLSGLHYNAASNHLLVISDKMNAWLAVDMNGEVLKSGDLPSDNQEGIAVDDRGFWYIACDSGGVLKLKKDAHPSPRSSRPSK